MHSNNPDMQPTVTEDARIAELAPIFDALEQWMRDNHDLPDSAMGWRQNMEEDPKALETAEAFVRIVRSQETARSADVGREPATKGPWMVGQPDMHRVHPNWRDEHGNASRDCYHRNGQPVTIATFTNIDDAYYVVDLVNSALTTPPADDGGDVG